MKTEDIVTKNVREDELNPISGYAMVRLENLQNTCKRGVTGYIRSWTAICYEWIDWIGLRTQLNEFEIFIWFYNDELEFRMTNRTFKNVLENSVNKTMYK